jgi:hypothetical protein
MPLSKEERDFLDAFVYEATHEPFGGPATTDLRRREIYYADLHGLLTSYHRELVNERTMPFGKYNPSPPPSPWANREELDRRNRVLMQECAGCQNAPPIPKGSDMSVVSPRHLPSSDKN